MEKIPHTKTISIKNQTWPSRILVRKAKLLVLTGSKQGHEFLIDKENYTIGSGPHNDLIIEDSTVSRQHCEIQYRHDEGYKIKDLGSTNGTFVQGVRVSEAYLSEGTEFRIGHTRIVFCPLLEMTEYVLSNKTFFGQLIGQSIPMRRVFYLAETYAPTDATILIEGETGTGKEILAEEIHKHSKRKDKPFVIIDCAALSPELIESELFGHVKGAFTGAHSDRIGAFEYANGGTVFLDEISTLSPDLQPKLLRVLERKQIKRVGSNEIINVDVRIICATNLRLENEVNAGRFREDLYYRCSVVHIHLPPLRNRKEDIPLLVEKFLKDFYGPDALEYVMDFEKTMEIFKNYDWPGNVRELRNVIELASYSGKKPFNLTAFLSLNQMKNQESPQLNFSADRPFKDIKEELIRNFEKEYLKALLKKHNGNISRAAVDAGIERTYLQKLIRKYQLK